MNIKEAEAHSGVSRRNIRFYEQKGLLAPSRNQENSYREYDEKDVETLKLIRVLRMIDMPLERVREVVLNRIPLQEAVSKHGRTLSNRIKELRTAVRFCEELASEEKPDINEVLRRMEEPENREKLSTRGNRDYAYVLVETAVYLFFGLLPIGVGCVTGALAGVFLLEIPTVSYVISAFALIGWGWFGYWLRGQNQWFSKSVLVHGMTGLFLIIAFLGGTLNSEIAMGISLLGLLGYGPVMATCMPLMMAFGWTEGALFLIMPFVMLVLSFACGVMLRSIKRDQPLGYSRGEGCVAD